VDLRGCQSKFYNQTLAELPDHGRSQGNEASWLQQRPDVKGYALPKSTNPIIGRVWISLGEISVHVQRAFIAPEKTSGFTSIEGSIAVR